MDKLRIWSTYILNIEIDNDERGVIGDFKMMSYIRITKQSLCDSNVTHHCKISYNTELGVIYFYSNMTIFLKCFKN